MCILKFWKNVVVGIVISVEMNDCDRKMFFFSCIFFLWTDCNRKPETGVRVGASVDWRKWIGASVNQRKRESGGVREK